MQTNTFEQDSSLNEHKIRELEQILEIKNKIIDSLDEQIGSKILEPSNNHRDKELLQENQMFKELLESFEGKEATEMEEFFLSFHFSKEF